MMEGFYTSGNKPELRAIGREVLDLCANAKSYINNSGYRCINLEQNPGIKERLELLGFFKVHITNKGKVVGEHQVVKFIRGGGLWILRFESKKNLIVAKGHREVHHKDGNRLNNEPSNLVYTTPQQNKLCADMFGQEYKGVIETPDVTRPGSPEGSNGAHDTARLLRMTAVATMRSLGFDTGQIPKVIHFLWSLPNKLGKKIYRQWIHDRDVRNAVRPAAVILQRQDQERNQRQQQGEEAFLLAA